MALYRYTTYGLIVDSELSLPGLLLGPAGEADVTIRFGPVPASPEEFSEMGVGWQASGSVRLMTVVGVARFLIRENREIVIDPELTGRANDVANDVWVWLLGSILAALLYGRHILVLHGSVICSHRGAVLLLGRNGVGKSTLLAGMLKRDYTMLADDKAAITVSAEGIAEVLPGYPLIRLTRDSVDALGYSCEESTYRAPIKKFILPVTRFSEVAAPLRAAYVLNTHNRGHIELERLTDLAGFEALREHLYRRRFVIGKGQQLAMFRALVASGRQAQITRVVRPEYPRLIGELADRIDEDLRAGNAG